MADLPSASATTPQQARDSGRSRTNALWIIAGLLLIAAAYFAATLVVPFVLACMLTIALAPLACRLERRGVPPAGAALLCTLIVAAVIAAASGLIIYQAGTIVQDSDRYISRFGATIDKLATRTRLGKSAATLGLKEEKREALARTAEGGPSSDEDYKNYKKGDGEATIRRGLNALGGWLVSGVGGLLGLVGGAVVFLAFLFYLLQGRDEWMASLRDAMTRLGMRPTDGQLEKVQSQIVRYLGCLSIVASCYVVVVTLVLWLIGVPQPLLWGLIAGMLEVVPYFGPVVASVMPTVVALSLGSLWQPLAVAGFFLVLHTLEGYVITPMLYGKAVKFDPVSILAGALFFGGIWGPVGLAVAMPMLITLRGLLVITPDTPALDALADLEHEKEKEIGASRARPQPAPSR